MFLFNKLLELIRNRFFAKDLEIAMVGLQNAGKSTLVTSINKGEFEDHLPTVGFNRREFKKGNVTLMIYDLAGQRRYRESWEKYCATSDCIIFVIDSSDKEQIEISKHQLEQLLEWESVEEIPLLVLGNKNDLPNCYTEEEIIDLLGLKNITDRKVACYSVSAKTNNNLDVVLKWLTGLNKIN